jgi:hypothetical protein
MIFQLPKASDVFGSLKTLVEDLNRFHPDPSRYPTFADNASALAANLKVGAPYVDSNGFMRRVM